MSTITKSLGVAILVAMLGLFAVPVSAETAGDPFPLNTCPVSGKELTADAVAKEHDGREVKFCCGGCPAKFEADPASFITKIDEAIVEQQKEHYPLETCLVSGKELGSMGDPVHIVVGNRDVALCCAGCEKPAKADVAKTIAKLNEAVIAKQSESYKATTCPVSGKELGSMGDPVNLVFSNQLIKICCAGCEGKVKANPAAALEKVKG